jgi:hypothetical protein
MENNRLERLQLKHDKLMKKYNDTTKKVSDNFDIRSKNELSYYRYRDNDYINCGFSNIFEVRTMDKKRYKEYQSADAKFGWLVMKERDLHSRVVNLKYKIDKSKTHRERGR